MRHFSQLQRALAVLILATGLLSGCKKDDKPVPEELYSFTGTVDNTPVRWEVMSGANRTDTSKYHARGHYFYSQWGMDCATSDCNDLATGIVVNQRNAGKGIQVVLLQASRILDLNSLKPLFEPGLKPFGMQRTNTFTQTQTGVLIRYVENGREWRSEIGDQTGSTFESLEFKPATSDKDRYQNLWKARFSCKLYFNGLPPKTLQNCEVYGPVFYK